jgi:D-alanyl-lipoteichoic acid acyltransferase DltB (MBOAT superfamily)
MNLDYLNPLILFPALALLALVYYLLPARWRWGWLLLCSYAFYFWISSWSILILLVSTTLNYALGLGLGKGDPARKKPLLITGIVLNLFILFLFKYFNSLLAGSSLLTTLSETTGGQLLVPVGISFFTLQNISYLVDVFKGIQPAERNAGIFALYHAFFPKVMAGPIERCRLLLPQLHSPLPFEHQNIYEALPLILFGLFKKVVIADRLALYVDKLFNEVGLNKGAPVWYGLVFLSFQIYLDFAGYTDIALGVARLFGIKLTPNFKRPYLSENIVEFWNSWHLSFSTWLRDYIFFPLRRYFVRLTDKSTGFLALIIPPLVTMLASGIWHGTGWTFVLWGLYHAVFYIGAVLVRSRQGSGVQRPAWRRGLNILFNFVVITFGWILFRAESLTAAWILFKSIFTFNISVADFMEHLFSVDFLLVRGFVLLVIAVEIFLEVRGKKFDFSRSAWWLRWLVYLFLVLCITILGVYPQGGNPFVYFRF